MLHLVLAILVAVVVHIAAMTIAARAIGVKVVLVSLGYGPTLFQVRGYRLGALPMGGYVRFRHTVDDTVPESQLRTAIDRRSTIEQLSVTFSGCFALLMLALAFQGTSALEAFLRFPSQVLAGAASPMDEAQSLLRSAASFLHAATFPATLALVAAKSAALNLVPLPALNGGAAIALLAKRAGIARWWPAAATRFLHFVWLGVLGSWLLAICLYAIKT